MYGSKLGSNTQTTWQNIINQPGYHQPARQICSRMGQKIESTMIKTNKVLEGSTGKGSTSLAYLG